MPPIGLDFQQFIALAATQIDAAVEQSKVNPDLLLLRSGLDETPLHYLVVENHVTAVARLIEAGAPVNVVNFCGSSPLLEATTLGYFDLCEMLLKRGADPSVMNNVGATSLSIAALRDRKDLFHLLLPYCTQDINSYFSDLDASDLQGRAEKSILLECRSRGLRTPFA